MKKRHLVYFAALAAFFLIYIVLFYPSYHSLGVSPSKYTPSDLTFDTIFDQIETDVPKAERITIIATGDIIPARAVNFNVVQNKNPFWPYEKVQKTLKNIDADIIFVNLETPLIENCQPTVEGMIFCGDTINVEGLTYIGTDIASLANNHIGDYAVKGIKDTIELLHKNGIAITGTDSPTYKTVNNTRFAFLGYNDIDHEQESVSWAEKDTIKREIQEAKKYADVVIVTFHFGAEYRNQPDNRQKELAHFTIDQGADLIIGNHPHWIQPIEIYKGKLITYAHGNFVFDQMWSEKTKEGVVGVYTFYGSSLIDVTYHPIKIEGYGQPYFVEGQEKQRILAEMMKESLTLSKTYTPVSSLSR